MYLPYSAGGRDESNWVVVYTSGGLRPKSYSLCVIFSCNNAISMLSLFFMFRYWSRKSFTISRYSPSFDIYGRIISIYRLKMGADMCISARKEVESDINVQDVFQDSVCYRQYNIKKLRKRAKRYRRKIDKINHLIYQTAR